MKLVRAALIGLCLLVNNAQATPSQTDLNQNARLAMRNGGVIILRIRESKVLQNANMGQPIRYVIADAVNVQVIANYLASSDAKPLVYVHGLGTYFAIEKIANRSLIGREIGSGMTVIVTGY